MSKPMLQSGMTSLAVAFPSVVRTNEYWRQHYPEAVAAAEQNGLAKLWGQADKLPATASPFERTMVPYMSDPFRGTVERRWRGAGETALKMEAAAARGALAARSLSVADIDLTLCSSFPADRFGVGNAPFLADELGIRTPAWNFETACSGSVVGLHLAASLLVSGEYRRILVVVSTSNSVCAEDKDSLGWFVGDGAGAFVVEPLAADHGLLGWKTINSIETNDMFVIHSEPDGKHGTRLRTRATEKAYSVARDTAEPYLRACIDGALSMASMSAQDVDFWLFNTPNAWYADFCGSVLGIPPDRYHSVYSRYANVGAVLMPATLYHAVHEGKVRPGQVVGAYSVGSTSTASALVARVGEIALGPFPERPAIADGPTWTSS